MYVKKCEFCNKYIKTKIERKRFCNNICQRKHYNSKPEIKKINRIRTREYRRNHPEWRERHRRSLHHALTKYTKTGKIMSSRKYGIDWKEVIKSLNPFPKI